MSGYLISAGVCILAVTITLFRSSGKAMIRAQPDDVNKPDEWVFNLTSAIGVPVTIITTSAGVILTLNITSRINQVSTVVIVGACVVGVVMLTARSVFKTQESTRTPPHRH